MNAIEIRNVSFNYGNIKALSSITLDIASGIRFCLLGPNGGGKSTLLKLISTLLLPQKGTIAFFGRTCKEYETNLRKQLGIVFQEPALDKKLSVLENLFHHGHLYGMKREPLKKRSDELLNFMGLADRRNERVETLSGGLKRRVEIAKSLIHNPKILILDEPTTGLDPVVRKEIWRDLKRQQQVDQITVLFTTHLLEEADDADRVVMLDKGKIVAEGSPKELKASVGEETISLRCSDAQNLSEVLEKQLQVKPLVVDNEVRLSSKNSSEIISKLIHSFRDQYESLTIGKPTLEDLFLLQTGRKMFLEERTV